MSDYRREPDNSELEEFYEERKQELEETAKLADKLGLPEAAKAYRRDAEELPPVRPVDRVFPENYARKVAKLCTSCAKAVDISVMNEVELTEYKISGMCKACQVLTFTCEHDVYPAANCSTCDGDDFNPEYGR